MGNYVALVEKEVDDWRRAASRIHEQQADAPDRENGAHLQICCWTAAAAADGEEGEDDCALRQIGQDQGHTFVVWVVVGHFCNQLNCF